MTDIKKAEGLTPTKLDELERLAKAATPGPWHQWEKEWIVGPIPSSDPEEDANEGVAYTVGDRQSEDAAHIAAANPQTILTLIAEIRRLRGGFGQNHCGD